jgi:transposase
VQAVQDWAQTAPQAHDLAITRWSLAWLQELWRAVRTDVPPARSTFRRWCKAIKLSWYRIRSWCTSSDPQYHAKLAAICDAYLHAPPDVAVLCYDQKPHLQALDRRVPLRPPRPGLPGRQEHDYHRNGTLDLHALYDTRSGRCLLACRPDHKQHTIADFLFQALRQWPQKKILLILDNLQANQAPAVRQALQRLQTEHAKTVTVLPTPTYSSWANQVERLFADLQRELLDYLEVPSTQALEEALQQWAQCRNTQPKPLNWTYHPDSALSATGH